MAIIRITNPDVWPVSVEDAKRHLYAEGTDEARDRKIRNALRAACDGLALESGRLFSRASYLQRLQCWPDCGYISLRACPIAAIESIAYRDEDEALQTVPEDKYQFTREPESGRILIASDYSLPALAEHYMEPIEVTFLGGYDAPNSSGTGDDPELQIPDDVIQAILLRMEFIFESGAVDPDKLADIDKACTRLLDTFRVMRF